MPTSVGVAEAKQRLSELVNRAAYARERFLIRRRGKPVGAIVSAEDLARLETAGVAPAPRGLLAAVGALSDIEDWEQIMDEVRLGRAVRGDRDVELE